MTPALSEIPAKELHALYALALMCGQYIGDEINGREVLDHLCMGAGEEAYKVLESYALIDVQGRGATWTALGLEILELRLNQEPFPS